MKYFYTLLSFLAIVTLSGCSSSDDTNQKSNSLNISGYVVANNIHDANVTARDENHKVLGQTQTDKDGKYTINIGNYQGVILLDVIGGSYIDEYLNKSVKLSTMLRASSVIENINNIINITPLTEIAFREINATNMEPQNIKNINESLSNLVSDLNNPIDIIKTIPSTITNTSFNDEKSKYYGLLLAAFSANGDLNSTLNEIVSKLTLEQNTISDNGLDELISKNLDKLHGIAKNKVLFENMKKLFNKKAVITPNFNEITNQKDVSLLVSGKGVVAYKYSLDNKKYSKTYSINKAIRLTNLSEGKHKISVIVKSKKGNWLKEKDSTTFSWENDYTFPIVTLDKPAGKYTQPMLVNFNVKNLDTLYYTTDGSIPFEGTNNTFESNSTVSIFINEPKLIKYYAADKAKNITEIQTLEYILPDKFAPTVKLNSPLNNSVSYNTQPTIELELKDASGLDYSTLRLSVDNVDVTKEVTISNNKVYFTPKSTFSDKRINVNLQITDNSGNTVDKHYSFIVDSSPLKIKHNKENGFYKNSFYLRLTANRPSKVYYTLNNTRPVKNGRDTLISNAPLENLRIYENTTVKYFAEDAFGNVTEIKSLKFLFDTELPVVINSSVKKDGYINSLKPVFDINFTDTLSGIDVSRVEFKVNGFSKARSATITDENLKYVPQFDLEEDINTMELFLVDNVGNNRYYLYNYRLDVTKPISSSTHQSTTYNKDINITINSNEKGHIYYTLDGSTPTIEATKKALPLTLNIDKTTNLKYIIEDLAKNQEELKEYTFTIDKTKPDTPENLVGQYKDQSVELKWNSISQSDLSSYNIYRSINDDPYIKIATVTQNNFIDNNASQALIKYKVTSEDTSHNESGFSNNILGTVENSLPIITLDTNETLITNQNEFMISGSITDNSIIQSVTINGNNIYSLDNFNTWNYPVTLKEGDNLFTIVAIDEYDNLSTKKITIIKDTTASHTTSNISTGIYNSVQNIKLTTNEPDAKIYYTTDKSEPSLTNGTLYINEIENITTDTIIKYRSIDKANNIEPIQTVDLFFAFVKPAITESSFKNGDVFLLQM